MTMIPRLMGIMPFGIGLTVLFFVWTGGMGNPPLFFKVVASFIALSFVMIGLAFFAGPGLLKGQHRRMLDQAQEMADSLSKGETSSTSEPDAPPQKGYSCPNCGSDLGEDADVSPSGDAKCEYCKRWFNIHS
ncbi:MAG: hypothetical protein H8E37_09830 [Planctomycetes bacterium]|nr:hypothetical protein [Planctomycetota bacterium]